MKTYIAKKPLIHDQLGRIEKDQKFEATDAQVSPVKRFVEEYETKIHPQEPVANKPRRMGGRSHHPYFIGCIRGGCCQA